MTTTPVKTGRKVTEFEVAVRAVKVETPDMVTLVLDTPADRPAYTAGQFCTIAPKQFPALAGFAAYLEQVKGRKEQPRAYSLSSAPHEALAITIKEERFDPPTSPYPPLLSPLLVHHAQVGMRFRVSGFTGPYVLPDDVESRTDHVVHVVAGSGAVPNFSIVKDSLHRGHRLKHTFISSNKTIADICFRAELEALARAHPDTVELVLTVTREPDHTPLPAKVLRGRVTGELLDRLIPDKQTCLVYVCGPAISAFERRAALEKGVTATPRFLETVLGHLHELGVNDKRIKREAYG